MTSRRKPSPFVAKLEAEVERKAPRWKVRTKPADVTALEFGIEQANKSFAWLRIALALDELAKHPDVTANGVAVEFVQAVRAVADRAILADSAREVLEPLDELLPNGEVGARQRKTQGDRRRGKPAADPADETRDARLRAFHARHAHRRDATSATAAEFGLSTRTVRRILAR